MKQKKEALRVEMKAVREQLQKQAGPMVTRLVASQILRLPEVSGEVQRGIKARSIKPHIVAGFYPTQTEIDCILILKVLSAIHSRCALPIVTGHDQPLIFKEWDLVEGLVDGPFGTKNPSSDLPTVIPDLLLVPLLAFDEKGNRLGYGRGFYDRTLADYRDKGYEFTAIGVAYDGQKRDDIPRDCFDQPLDFIVTEKKVYRP